jgi:hypothetical protein
MIKMKARGQTLVLVALTFLLLTVMVCMTLSIGTAAARKADLANAADAAAYSNAIATARTFNTASLLNRTIVSHYVAMSGVQAQIAYASTVHNYFNLAANMFRMYDVGGVNPITLGATIVSNTTTGCNKRTTEVRDASYEMWHAALSVYNPSPGGTKPGDNVNGYCQGGNCTAGRPWQSVNETLLEKDAADQANDIHDAIWDLGRIEDRTYAELSKSISTNAYADKIATAAGLGTPTISGKTIAGTELDDATANGIASKPVSFQRPFAEAVLGTRRRREPLILPNITENLPPLLKQMQTFTDAAFAAYPGQPFSVTFSPTNVSADLSFEPAMQQMIEEPLGGPLHPTMDFAFGRAVDGRVVTTYRDACLGRTPIIITSGNTAGTPSPAAGGAPMIAPSMEVIIRSDAAGGFHRDYGVGYIDGSHWSLWTNPAPFGGCHGTHEHYQFDQEDPTHKLRASAGAGSGIVPAEVLGFVLPDDNPTPDLKGARGVWGQPLLPVMLTQKHDPSKDPFNLTVGFRFAPGGGQPFNMAKAVDSTLAPAAGIAYYHRRGHLGEPPNMLNPFWHATLVPVEIDERKDGSDPTENSQAGGSKMISLINSAPGYSQKADALQAYNGLKNHITGLTKSPQLSDP